MVTRVVLLHTHRSTNPIHCLPATILNQIAGINAQPVECLGQMLDMVRRQPSLPLDPAVVAAVLAGLSASHVLRQGTVSCRWRHRGYVLPCVSRGIVTCGTGTSPAHGEIPCQMSRRPTLRSCRPCVSVSPSVLTRCYRTNRAVSHPC